MGNPRFVMLDEPFLGLSPKMVEEIRTVVRRIAATGVTVLFNEQSLNLPLGMSNRGYILESGRLALSGTSEELLADPSLHRIYMGLDQAVGLRLEIVKRPVTAVRFEVPPRRWVIERGFAWPTRNRRLATDYERLIDSATAMAVLAFIQILARRIATA